VGVGATALDSLNGVEASASPWAVLVTGLAGGCAPGLRSADVVVGDPVGALSPTLGSVEVDSRLRARAVEALVASGLRYRVGPLLTVDEVVATPAAKAMWWQTRGALAVDMESGHVLAWARRVGLPAVAVRAIADGPDDEVPRELLAMVDAGGRVRAASVAGFLARPGLVGPAWRLARQSREALGSLARFVQAFVDDPSDP
jgi:adenosylhomocysteine nucleosidase